MSPKHETRGTYTFYRNITNGFSYGKALQTEIRDLSYFSNSAGPVIVDVSGSSSLSAFLKLSSCFYFRL